MPDEFDGYRDSVLDAARQANNVPPPDLFTRYHLDPRQVQDKAEFTRRVELVVKYWRKLKLQRKYQQLATALLAADSDLRRKRQLTYEFFEQQRGSARGAAQSKLDSRVAAIAESTPCVTLAALRRLVSTMDGAFDEQEVRAALAKNDVTVVDPPWETVNSAPVGTSRALRTPLTTLGLRLSPEVIFGEEVVRAGFTLRNGFRLADGRTVTMDTLVTLRDEHSRSKHDERKTAVDNVLTILIKAAEKGDDLHRLLLWEVQEQLRPDVEAGLPVRAVASAAQELGLDANEALALAATLSGGGEGQRDDGIAARVAAALRSGELHEAATLLAELPATEAAEARAQLAEAQRQADELVRRAEQAMAEDSSEEAAGLFAAAAQIARDDETLPARIAGIAPPPPTDVTVSRQLGKVAMRWTPSAVRMPGVRYVVVRTVDEPAVSVGGGTRVGETESNETVDSEPEAAEPTYYTVFATRAEGVWSAGRSVGPVEMLPEVGDIELRGVASAVSGSWRAHPAAVDVVITRTDRATPDAQPQPVHTTGSPTFTDRNVVNGHTYDYTFRAVYLTRARQRRMSAPVVVSVTPTEPPGSVREISYEVVPGRDRRSLRLSWRPPTHGTVEVRISADPPGWPADTLIERSTARGFGQPASDEATVSGDTVTMTVPAPQGRMVLTAFVVSGGQARVGASIALALVDPVTDLRTERFDDQLRLRWVWPRGANLARISWHPTGTDSRVHGSRTDITRRAYVDGGGARIDVSPGAVMVSVATVTRDRGEEHVSAAVTASVPGDPTRVTYGVRPSGLFAWRRQDLILTADRSCRLPGLLVVHRADGIVPLRPDSGSVVARVEPCDLSPGTPVTVPLPQRVQPVSGLACFVAPDSPPADEVTLVSAPVG